MKKMMAALAAIALAAIMAGCTTVSPIGATGNSLGSKVGEASTTFICRAIPIPLTSDGGIAKAAKNGKITKISTVDQKVYDILGIYTFVTTVVTGE